MKILVIGGTGTMGRPLIKLLADKRWEVYGVSRHKPLETDAEIIRWHIGNAKEFNFIKQIVNERFDCIVDFMWYSLSEFKERYEYFLQCTSQYIAVSSAAVYSDSSEPITEKSTRIIEKMTSCDIVDYEEYHFAKAGIENLLFESKYKNWTIIRPHITFNSNRLPLCTYEKEVWLYRALKHREITVAKDMMERKTTLSYGGDIAKEIFALIGKEETLGEVYNLASDNVVTWGELIDIYNNALEDIGEAKLNIRYISTSEELCKAFPSTEFRIKYDRLYDRVFNIDKILDLAGDIQFESLNKAIKECLMESRRSVMQGGVMLPHCHAWMDRYSKGNTSLSEIKSARDKFIYLIFRYSPSYYFLINLGHRMKG